MAGFQTMGRTIQNSQWVTLRRLSLENGWNSAFAHEKLKKVFFVGVRCERAGAHGWIRLQRGPQLDFLIGELRRTVGQKPIFHRPKRQRTADKWQVLERIAAGAVKPEATDAAAAIARVVLGALVANDGKNPLPATVAR